jgi:hypothetical protein
VELLTIDRGCSTLFDLPDTSATTSRVLPTRPSLGPHEKHFLPSVFTILAGLGCSSSFIIKQLYFQVQSYFTSFVKLTRGSTSKNYPTHETIRSTSQSLRINPAALRSMTSGASGDIRTDHWKQQTICQHSLAHRTFDGFPTPPITTSPQCMFS